SRYMEIGGQFSASSLLLTTGCFDHPERLQLVQYGRKIQSHRVLSSRRLEGLFDVLCGGRKELGYRALIGLVLTCRISEGGGGSKRLKASDELHNVVGAAVTAITPRRINGHLVTMSLGGPREVLGYPQTKEFWIIV